MKVSTATVEVVKKLTVGFRKKKKNGYPQQKGILSMPLEWWRGMRARTKLNVSRTQNRIEARKNSPESIY